MSVLSSWTSVHHMDHMCVYASGGVAYMRELGIEHRFFATSALFYFLFYFIENSFFLFLFLFLLWFS